LREKSTKSGEKAIIKDKTAQDTMLHVTLDKQDGQVSYLMRKRPLINPTTQDTVGIMIFASKFNLARVRRMFLKAQKHKLFAENSVDISPFTEHQQLVVNCLLLPTSSLFGAKLS